MLTLPKGRRRLYHPTCSQQTGDGGRGSRPRPLSQPDRTGLELEQSTGCEIRASCVRDQLRILGGPPGPCPGAAPSGLEASRPAARSGASLRAAALSAQAAGRLGCLPMREGVGPDQPGMTPCGPVPGPSTAGRTLRCKMRMLAPPWRAPWLHKDLHVTRDYRRR